jgi:hypothetical protein
MPNALTHLKNAHHFQVTERQQINRLSVTPDRTQAHAKLPSRLSTRTAHKSSQIHELSVVACIDSILQDM